jgi:hypothetical protein
MKLEPALERQGIRVMYSKSKEIGFQISAGKMKKITFDPKDIYAMAMYAKGREPKLATGFSFGDEMRTIISEYFHIKIE